MKRAYILVGMPGSGKTTWTKNQDWASRCAVVSTDLYVEQHALAVGKTYNEVFEQYMPTAVRLMTDAVIEARENDLDIIWDQTSLTVASRAKKFRMLPDYYHIAVIFRTPPPQELSRRLNSRHGKIIPETVLAAMSDSYVQPTEQEGYKEIWHVT